MEDIKNVRIFATPSKYEQGGINLYIDFSGQREYLCFYRFNYYTYTILKHGITIDELEALSRERHCNRSMQAAVHSAQQINKIARDYIKYDYLPYRQAA